MKRLQSKGETIIEVLIAMTIASMVMASAFGVVNRSTANARSAQEHGEALQIAEAQLEQSKSLIFPGTPAGVYCIAPATDVLPARLVSQGSSLPATYNDYDNECKGAKISSGYDGYATGIVYKADGTYKVSVTWEGSRASQQVSLAYKTSGGTLTASQIAQIVGTQSTDTSCNGNGGVGTGNGNGSGNGNGNGNGCNSSGGGNVGNVTISWGDSPYCGTKCARHFVNVTEQPQGGSLKTVINQYYVGTYDLTIAVNKTSTYGFIVLGVSNLEAYYPEAYGTIKNGQIND